MSDLERDLRSLIDGSPSIDADEVRYRSGRRSRAHTSPRRPLALVLAIVVLAAVVGVVALLRSGGREDGSVVVPAQLSPAPAPEEVVTIAEDGRVAVLDRSGTPTRLLTGSAEIRPAQLSVAPDGTVYFSSAALGTIVDIPGDGGVCRNVLGEACCIRYPSVSPDGRWLAFSGVPNQSDAGRHILIKARDDDGATYDRRWSGGSTLDTGVEILGWTPDSSAVVFVDHDDADPRPRILDIATPESASLDDQPVLDVPAGLSFAGFRGTSDRLVLLDRTSAPNRVVGWDRTSNSMETLFTLDGLQSVGIDPSGDHLLAVTSSGLYRWSSGDATPTMIAPALEGIVAAAWLPAPPDGTSTVPTTGTSDPPPNSTADGLPAVQVLNGSGVMGAATQRTDDLKAKGWQVLTAGNAPEVRDGAAIRCFDGFASAAAQLRADLRSFGVDATIEALPNPLPLGYDTGAVCYVILGR